MSNEELSKIVSHALRHKPDDYNLQLSKDGWVSVSELVLKIKNKFSQYTNLTTYDIELMVSNATKKRHEIVGNNIRALHGHSLDFEIINFPLTPPAILYHATATKYNKKINEKGLDKMGRDFLHLSAEKNAAIEVAAKKYKEVLLLQIEAHKAFSEGILFYSNDGKLTWLCKHIPPQYISIVIE